MKKIYQAKQVVTYNNELRLFKDCKKIKGVYYVKNESCFQIEGKWYSINSNFIFYDNRLKKYAIRRKHIIMRGFYDDTFKTGEFSYCPYNTVDVICETEGIRKQTFADKSILKELGYVESIFADVWINSKNKEAIRIYSDLKTFNCKDYNYNIEDDKNYMTSVSLYNNAKISIDKDTRKASKLIGDITFGFEMEVNQGWVPQSYQNQLGLGVCKDGSIGYTPEFVSVPYQGVKGLQAMKNAFIEISKKCNTDYQRSLHFHIGNIRKDREFIIAFIRLTQLVQKELFLMFPPYKKTNLLKEKNYCKPYKNIINKYDKNVHVNYKNYIYSMFNSVQTFVLGGQNPNNSFNRKTKMHPNGKNKWNFDSRYYIINIVNMFLSNRNTLEFRLAHSTLSPVKNLNWFFICVAMVKYCEKNTFRILKADAITLNEILDVFNDTQVSSYLKAYVKERTNYFSDIDAENDCHFDANDTLYEFKFGNLDSIY